MNIFERIKQFIDRQKKNFTEGEKIVIEKKQSPTATPTPTPTATPTPKVLGKKFGRYSTDQKEKPDPKEVKEKISKGLRAYSESYAGGRKLPIEDHIDQFVEATQKYDVFAENPYLLPVISILESSGGLNVTRDNNPLNWAARVQKRGDYSPTSWKQSINDAVTAIGGDPLRGEAGSPRQRQIVPYNKFRRSGDLKDFANTYEPANPSYHGNLVKAISNFESI